MDNNFEQNKAHQDLGTHPGPNWKWFTNKERCKLSSVDFNFRVIETALDYEGVDISKDYVSIWKQIENPPYVDPLATEEYFKLPLLTVVFTTENKKCSYCGGFKNRIIWATVFQKGKPIGRLDVDRNLVKNVQNKNIEDFIECV